MNCSKSPLSWRRDLEPPATTDPSVPGPGDFHLQDTIASESTCDEEPGFVALAYPFIKLSDNASAAEVDPLECGSISGLPIVYYNKPISKASRVIFTVETKRPATEDESLMCKVGLTTCHPSRLKKYSFHVSDVCKGGSLAYRGWSTCLPSHKRKIFDEKSQLLAIVMEQQDAFACITRLITHFTDDLKTCAIRDKSDGGMMTSCSLYPFIILSGIVTKIRARAEPMYPNLIDLPSHLYDALASSFDEDETARVTSPDSWLVADGIDVHSKYFFRKIDGLPLCVCKQPLTNGQQYIFSISQVNEEYKNYTFTLGYTSVDVSSIDFNSSCPLQESVWAEGWTEYPNVLPVVEKDDEISIRVADRVVFIATQRYTSRPLIRNFPSDSHLFLYFTPNIKVIVLLRCPERGEKVEGNGHANGAVPELFNKR